LDSTTGLRSPRDLRPMARLTVFALTLWAVVDVLHTLLAVGYYEHRITVVTHGSADVPPAWMAYELMHRFLPGGVARVVADRSWLLASLFAAVAVIAWLDRARRHVARLGGKPAWAQWWAIGGWLIPLANLVIPFLVMRDVKRAAGTAARPAPVSAWWAGVLATLLVQWLGWVYPTVTARGGTFDQTALDTRWAAYPLWSAATVLTVLTAILTARVVRRVTQAQRWSAHAQRWTEAGGTGSR
jgi:hypothetical protein